jgi:hypothetical protein
VVSEATATVAGTTTHATVDSAVQSLAPPSAPQPSVDTGPGPSLGRGVSAKAAASRHLRLDRPRPARSRRHSGAPAHKAHPTGPPTGSVTAKEVGGASHRAVTGPVPSAHDDVSLDPAAGGIDGSPASGASAAFSFGGAAVLLATVFLAAAALRRRIPGYRAFCPPAAFVPLLERPG